MESAKHKWHPLYVLRPWKTGEHIMLPLYRPVLRILGYDFQNDNELLIIRVHPPFVTFRVAHPPQIFPLTDVELAAMPPAWPAPSSKDPNE